jgi:tRNA(Ile)-lysidine synthase
MALTEVVLNALRQAERERDVILLDGRRLVVAVSGGADSLALLHSLCRIVPTHCLLVAHLNHQLRPSAAEDAEAVAAIAAKWKVKVQVGEADVAALAREQGLSIEEAGRKARYAFLAKTARAVKAAAVLVAHHADDQAETVLMHLLRGSGLAGLRGMPLNGPLPGAADVLLVRPLLTLPKAEIEAYCQAHGLLPREDETNQDPAFFRNRLRHELLPNLSTYTPQIKRRLQNLAAITAADYELLDSVVDEAWLNTVANKGSNWLQFDLAAWRAQPLSARRALLRRAVACCRPGLRDLGFESIEQARRLAEEGTTGTQATLPGAVELRVEYKHLTLSADPRHTPFDLPQLSTDRPVELPVPGRVLLANGWVLVIELIASPDLNAIRHNPDPWQAFVALPENARLELRPRKPGERFQPLGMAGQSAALKDVMVNRKIPAAARSRWPVVATMSFTESHLVWLAGHGIDGRFRVTGPGERVVHLQLYRQPPGTETASGA